MKKMILLLVLPLTVLMAIDFTMTEKGLFAETTTHTPTPETSSYLEPVNLPKCDAGNPEVQFIRSNADWSKINSSSKRIFCVSPGDYRSLGKIIITASGTTDKRRYIVLNNGNNTHPGKLDKSQLANYALHLKAASFWVIERAASINADSHSYILDQNSKHNIFNRLFTQNVFHTMWIKNHAHNNTIQNSRFDGITDKGAAADLATVNIVAFNTSKVEVINTKVINNEFVNVKALRLARAVISGDHYDSTSPRQEGNFEGTIFYGNNIEFTTSTRTDCKGNFTETGDCAALEATAIGIKGGSENADNPVILSNNRLWGHRTSDPTYKTLSSPGGLTTTYMGAKHVHINNNIIFDGSNGITIADRYDAKYGSEYAEIKGNLIVNCGSRPHQTGASSLRLSQAQGMIVSDNTIINPLGYYSKVRYNFYNNYYGNNIIINKGSGLLVEGNHETIKGLNTNIEYSTAEEAGYTEDYSFTTDKFTNTPRVITLKNVIKK